jgi:hypothetical protein
MPLYRASLRTLGATALLAVALACGGKGGSSSTSATSATITGTVTYTRVPLATDTNGLPTGLVDDTIATNLKSLPARGVVIRAYQQVQQTKPDGTFSQVWVVATTTLTDATTGAYSLTVTKGRPTMVEVLSSFNSGSSSLINLVAEAAGINSPTLVLNRARYALRKAADGSSPAGNNTPNYTLNADAVVNFSVGLNDAWWVIDPSFNLSNSEAPLIDQAILETDFAGRTTGQGSGSRILGIGDTIASFLTNYGTASPGTTLDLHYWPGRTEPRGSYIEYDRTRFPQAYDSSTGRFHFFGSLSAGPTNDDAWDEGVILPLLARGVLYSGNSTRTFSVPLNPLAPQAAALTDLSPDLARIEGLADAMAANVLKSPYLADTQGTLLAAPLKDVRDITGLGTAQLTPYSAPAIRAFAWEVILKANSLPSPGLATNWANINPLATTRFFMAPSSLTQPATATTSARDSEPLNVFSQISRLKEGKTTTEPVDLAAIFTDPVLSTLGAPFGITWTRPTTGAYAVFVADWGTDPTGALPSAALSMSKASQVNGVYPNVSQGEVFYAGFALTVDKRCTLSATITPPLVGTDARIDVDLPMMSRTFSFTGSGGTVGVVTIPAYTTAPVYHPVRVRLVSPTTLQPDVTVSLTLTPAP